MRLLALLLVAGPLLAQEPMDARGWLNRGVTEFKSGNYAQAAADFQRAVDGDPSNAVAHLYLATAWMQQYIPGAVSPDNTAAAAAAGREFLKVLELDPRNETAMAYLGSLNLNQKKWDEAEAWYKKLVAVNPGNAVAWYSMGFIAWSRWYPAEAAARAKLGMKLEDPGPMPAGAVKADLITRYQTVIEDGLHALREALRLDPQYSDAMAYMNLLIRERADLLDNAADYQRDISEANAWVDKAMAAKKAQMEQNHAMGMAAPPPPPPPPQRSEGAGGGGGGDREIFGVIRVSGDAMEKMLVRHTPPVYPEEARKAGISGSVTLSVVVGEDGTVKQVIFKDGPQALAQAASDAVRKWIYKPTLFNDEAVTVETTVTVNFPPK
jgi:TonB family protein